MEGPLGLKMSEKEQVEYMEGLIKAKDSGLVGAENIALSQWRDTTMEINKTVENLNKVQTEVKRLVGLVQQLHGQRMAYVQLLVASEEGRRNKNLELVPKVPENGV